MPRERVTSKSESALRPFVHFALSPVLLGRGEAMFENLDLPALGYRVVESTATEFATHVVLGRDETSISTV